jgi:carboxymethylenebutenolidase
MTKRIDYETKDGHVLQGEEAAPQGDGKAAGVVVVQEWHGCNDVIKSTVDRFAAEGFLAFAPDLYHGKIAKDDAEAAAMMNALDKPKAVHEIADAVAHMRALPRSNGKVAVVGFCLGGGLTLATLASVATVPGVDAAVPFYGLPGIPADRFAKVKTPILAHFAKNDDWAKASEAEAIQKAVKGGGGSMELHVYDAGHAFMRVGGASYSESNAKTAWERTIGFLKKHLG